MCRDAGVPLVINDFARVAAEVGADGVHIGQDDGSLADVRAIVGEEMIVGRSTHSPQQAFDARDEGFDYIGFGPLFPTPTKKGRPGIGMENIALVQQEVGCLIPVFCIGGIKPENLEEVMEAGAHRVVIVSSLLQAAHIADATRSVVHTLNS
jgi:thiamine-phosphate pyrophosphorylase